MMNQMITPPPVVPAPPVPPTPSQTVQTPKKPAKSLLGWLIAGSIVFLGAIGLMVWTSQRAEAPTEEMEQLDEQTGALPTAEPTDVAAGDVQLTAGDSLEEIEQDLSATQLQDPDTDSELQALKQEASAVP